MNAISSSKENAIACAPLRDKQVEVVSNLLEGHDAFGVLPTGLGKSLFWYPTCLTIYLE